ncbi:Hyaluronan synthase [uncultured Blautia sp.]|nr:Hyaluronan synthase [uncultured Blautia sp.]SCK04152.1 Hyaluronan synthase [uncultured Clostridium sp.]
MILEQLVLDKGYWIMNSLVSVIVPIYNVEKYLERCISSILEQSYNNIEVILVDDGSNDGCPIICDKFERKDARVKVVHKPNGGLSSARNAGLEQMKGEYITFIDSDDWVEVNFVERMVEAISKSKVDVVQCGYCKKNDDNVVYVSTLTNEIVYGKDKILKSFFVTQNYQTMACMKLYKSEIFRKIKFHEGKNNEDTIYFADYIDKVNSIQVINDVLYNYYVNTNSIMHSELTKRKVEDAYFSGEYMLKKCEEKYPEFTLYMRRNICDFSIGLYMQADNSQKQLKKEIYKKFKNNYILLVKSSCLDIKKRLKFWLFYKNQFLTSKFWRIKKSL